MTGELCYFSLLLATVLFLLTVVQSDLASVVRVVAGRAQSSIETHTVNISHTGTHWDTHWETLGLKVSSAPSQCVVLTRPVNQEQPRPVICYFKQKIF